MAGNVDAVRALSVLGAIPFTLVLLLQSGALVRALFIAPPAAVHAEPALEILDAAALTDAQRKAS